MKTAIKTTTPSVANTPITIFSVAISCMAAHYSIDLRLPHGQPKDAGRDHLQAGDDPERVCITHLCDQHPGEQRSARMPDIAYGSLHAHACP